MILLFLFISFRNLFFRVNHLLQLGIGLVFVIDGCPPKMKRDTIQKRLNHAHRTNDNIGDWKKQPYRNRFNIFLREVYILSISACVHMHVYDGYKKLPIFCTICLQCLLFLY